MVDDRPGALHGANEELHDEADEGADRDLDDEGSDRARGRESGSASCETLGHRRHGKAGADPGLGEKGDHVVGERRAEVQKGRCPQQRQEESDAGASCRRIIAS